MEETLIDVKMNKNYLLIVLLFLSLTSVSALEITDTTFFSSATNFTIFVDSITLDNVTITENKIEFHNLSSIGSKFTNTNATFDARADFIGLNLSLRVRNFNTSENLFLSTLGSQNFNATFISGHTITIVLFRATACNLAERLILNTTLIFFALAILFIAIALMFRSGKLFLDLDARKILIVFVGVIIGVVFIAVLGQSIADFCKV